MTQKNLLDEYGKLGEAEFDKQLYIEYLTVCCYMSDEDFENFLNIERITDAEFFCITDFLYHNDCYNILFRVLRDNRKRIIRPNVQDINEMELHPNLEVRMKRYLIKNI